MQMSENLYSVSVDPAKNCISDFLKCLSKLIGWDAQGLWLLIALRACCGLQRRRLIMNRREFVSEILGAIAIAVCFAIVGYPAVSAQTPRQQAVLEQHFVASGDAH
jgi:hypothetical protein